jgi:hypothetical protein
MINMNFSTVSRLLHVWENYYRNPATLNRTSTFGAEIFEMTDFFEPKYLMTVKYIQTKSAKQSNKVLFHCAHHLVGSQYQSLQNTLLFAINPMWIGIVFSEKGRCRHLLWTDRHTHPKRKVDVIVVDVRLLGYVTLQIRNVDKLESNVLHGTNVFSC